MFSMSDTIGFSSLFYRSSSESFSMVDVRGLMELSIWVNMRSYSSPADTSELYFISMNELCTVVIEK